MSKKNEYVATIFKRTNLGNGNFIFLSPHILLGKVDEETGTFIDKNGDEYLPIYDPDIMETEIDEGYFNLESLATLKEKTNARTLREAIAQYNYVVSKYIHIVTTSKDGRPIVVSNSIDEIKEDAMSRAAEAREELNKSEGNTSVIDENPNYWLGEEEYIDPNMIQEMMVDGKLSLTELRQLRNVLLNQMEDCDEAIKAIDLQEEATKRGESSVQLREDPRDKQILEEPDGQTATPQTMDMQEIYEKVKKSLIGQDEPLKLVLSAIKKRLDNPKLRDQAILLTGPSGVGKTFMISLISKYIGIPFYIADATRLSAAGYVGQDLEEVIYDGFQNAGGDVEKFNNSILAIDEIDKKGSEKKSDISGMAVLNGFLKLIDGEQINIGLSDRERRSNPITVDTGRIIKIFCGAFNDVYNNKMDKGQIGYGTVPKKDREKTVDDFVEKAGMSNEFMRRQTVIKLNAIDLETMKRILNESDQSILKREQEAFAKIGVRLTFDEGFINKLCKRLMETKDGLKGIRGAIENTTACAYFEAGTSSEKCEEIIITEATLDDPNAYVKVLKK